MLAKAIVLINIPVGEVMDVGPEKLRVKCLLVLLQEKVAEAEKG